MQKSAPLVLRKGEGIGIYSVQKGYVLIIFNKKQNQSK